jgi:transcription antitermination factor NusG
VAAALNFYIITRCFLSDGGSLPVLPSVTSGKEGTLMYPAGLDSSLEHARKDSDPPWFAVQTRVKAEARVAKLLEFKGYECFLPIAQFGKNFSKRIPDEEVALFPGYLFCRCGATVTGLVVTTPGVARIVSFGGVQIPISHAEMDGIVRIVQSQAVRRPWPFVSCGTEVRISSGGLAGLRGFVLTVKNKKKLVVSIRLLQRSVMVELDSGMDLEIISR